MNNLRQIRTIIYRLKRNFGTSIKFVKVNSATYTLKTGATSQSETSQTISHALVLPVKIARQAFVSAPQFAYGAVEDSNMRIVVIDAQDYSTLPTLNDFIEYNGLRWNIKDVDATALDQHVLLTIQSVASRTV